MTDNNQHDAPTPGPNEPVPAWPEYRHLREALQAYLDHDPPKPQYADVWRAIAVVLGEYQRDAFMQAFDLDRPAERPCIRRLITGEAECSHSPLEADSGQQEPPHRPPASDNATLWLDETGEPALYGMHLYPGNIELLVAPETPRNQWFDIFEFAAKWGLEVSVLPKSWYNLGSAVHVVFYPPERYR